NVALGAAAAQLDDPRTDRLDPRDDSLPVPGGKALHTLHERDQHVTYEAGAIFRGALAQHDKLTLRGRPVTASRERHRQMRGVEVEPLAIEPLPRDLDEGAPAFAHVVPDEREPPQQGDGVVEIARDRRRRALECAASDRGRALEFP